MRKQLIGLVVAAVALLVPAVAHADTGSSVRIELNGQMLPISGEIVENRALVPVRGVLEALGAQVTWDNNRRVVIATMGSATIELPVEASVARVNGRMVPLDVPARIENGSVYIPVRFMAENLGARVAYDMSKQLVQIDAHGGGTTSRGGIVRDTARLQAKLVATASSLLGSRYVYGGTSPSGFDCSGFTSYLYGQIGISLPRTAAEQFHTGTAVSVMNLQPGDLMFWDVDGDGVASHTGVYVGNGEFIHAENAGTGVVTTSIWRAWWVPKYMGARRILPSTN